MGDPVRLLAFAPEGLPPCGRLLVRMGRVALVEATPSELAAAQAEAVMWVPGDPVPLAVPELEPSEEDFVAAAALAAVRSERLHDGASWDTPGLEPPDAPE